MKKIYALFFIAFVFNAKAQVSISSTTNATCPGGCDGSAVVQISGGTTPYTISFIGTNTFTYTTSLTTYTATNLCAGSSAYTVIVTDNLGNTVGTANAAITAPAPINANITYTNTTCGLCNGAIKLNTTGGTPPYTYSSNAGTNPLLNNLCAGTYSITITDAHACQATFTSSVVSSSAPAAPNLTNAPQNPLIECQGVSPATLSLTTTASLTPVWRVGTSTIAMGQIYTPSTATPTTTIYTIIDSSTVTGCTSASNGGFLTVTVTINPAPGSPTLSPGNPNPIAECQGGTPATLSLTTTASSVTHLWYNGSTIVAAGSTFTPNTSTPGTMVYTVSDSINTPGGCTNNLAGNPLTITVTINPAPAAPSLKNAVANPLIECQGGNPATFSLTTNTNIIPLWYNGSTLVHVGQTYSPNTSVAGTTVYMVSDSATVTGCTNTMAGNVLTLTLTINPMPNGPTLAGSTPNALKECQGQTPTTLSLTPVASVVPIWYAGSTVITEGQSYTPNTSVPMATTVFSILDSSTVNGCVSIGQLNITVTINPVPTINVSSVIVDQASCGGANGGISGLTGSDITGGTPSYHYQWYNGSSAILNDTLLSLNGVTSGIYSLQVTDKNHCMADGPTTFTVPGWAPPTVSFVLQKNNSAADTWDAFPSYAFSINKAVWYWGDGTSTVGLYPSHTYAAPGLYKICVSAFTTCGDSASSCQNDSVYRLAYNSTNGVMVHINVIDQATGIQQHANNSQLSIYPNPNSGTFTIETNSTEKQNLMVFDVNGKLVLNQTINGKTSIDAGALAEGVYNISIIGTTGAVNKRLMIVR